MVRGELRGDKYLSEFSARALDEDKVYLYIRAIKRGVECYTTIETQLKYSFIIPIIQWSNSLVLEFNSFYKQV